MEQTPRQLTEQEVFWKGEFGDAYCDRNKAATHQAASIAFFSKVLAKMSDVRSVIECGANIGLNMRSLRTLLPQHPLTAVEINTKAAATMRENLPEVEVLCQSFLDLDTSRTWDLSFTMGVLIHIAPEMLPIAYDILYKASSRYVMVGEYYNPTPMEVSYRGYTGRLFKRDFAGEMLDAYPDLVLVDYGFVYHRDNIFPLDDISYFIMRKR